MSELNLYSRNDFSKSVRFQGTVTEMTSSARLLQGLRALALCWLGALLFIFIPVLHFVLVPLAFLLGPFFFLREHKKGYRLSSPPAPCPHCQEGLQIPTTPFLWPMKITCSKCQNLLLIEEAGAKQG